MEGGVSNFFKTAGAKISELGQTIKSKFRELSGGDKKANEIAPKMIAEKNEEWKRATPQIMNTHSTAKTVPPKMENSENKMGKISENQGIAKKSPVMGSNRTITKENKPEVKEKKPEVKEKKPEVKEKKPEVKENKPEVKENKPEVKENKIDELKNEIEGNRTRLAEGVEELKNFLKEDEKKNKKMDVPGYVNRMTEHIKSGSKDALPMLWMSVEEGVHGSVIEKIVSQLFDSDLSRQQLGELVKFMTKHQVLSGKEDESNLLRSNTFASKALVKFSEKFVLSDLKRQFADIKDSVPKYDRSVEKKLEKANIFNKNAIKKTIKNQNSELEKFLDDCFVRSEKFKQDKSSDSLQKFNEISASIKEIISAKFDTKTANVVSGNLFTLRVFNPLMANLARDESLNLEPQQKDALVYASKVIQKMSNEKTFETKDGSLVGLNPWIEKKLKEK